MEIKLKKIGNTRGTIGWLTEGLTNGSILISEGKGESDGYHGLWLKETKDGEKSHSEFLAGFNVFGAGPAKYSLWPEFDSDRVFTPSARKAIINAAQEWVDEMNEALETEETIEIKIIRVETNPAIQPNQSKN
jgi:hypothetical protein